MWNVWNSKFWELKCLNWGVWILKAENWKLKSLCEVFGIWNFENWNVWILKVENWKLKSLFEISWKNLKCLSTKDWKVWILKTEMSKY